MKRNMLVSVLSLLIVCAMAATAAQAADLPFKGVTLIVVNNAGGNSDSMKKFAEPWEKMTGATVEMNPIPFGDIKDKILAAVSTSTFIADVFVVPSGIGGDLITGGYIMEVPEAARQELKFDDLLDSYREMNMKWGDKYYAWPWDGDLHMLNYRKDLFDDPKNKEAFKKEFGYDLDVPKTWKQYGEIAKFFTGTKRGVEYGWAEVAGRKNGSFHAFSDRAVGYAKHPDDPAFYFDPKTMDARINNPGFVKAMEDWVAAIPYAPADVTTYGFFETEQSFVTGQSALCVNWTDVGVLANDPDNSVVTGGKASYAILPGSSEVYNGTTGKWEHFDKPNQPGYAAFGGWIVMIPKNAKQPEAAMSFAKYLGSPEVMTKISQTPLSGVNPARKSTLNDLQGWIKNAKFPSEENAKAYTNAQLESLMQKNVVFQLRIPGYAQYEDALELAISEALTKQKTPKEALDIAAKTWNEITDRLGREKQLGFYRASIGLPAK